MATSLTLSAHAQARGKRLKTVRIMTGLTRKLFEEKYGISASTIQSWEIGEADGLTEHDVKRLLPVLLKEGIACTEQWLLYGIGSFPHIMGISLTDELEKVT